MSNPINDGGPAFPGIAGESGYGTSTQNGISPNGETIWINHNKGLSLRDYFAAKALIALPNIGCGADLTLPELASEAYALADAMIAARETKP